MASDVKTRRRYDSSRRRAQAAATQREILDAAKRLIDRQGYAATSMAEIAAEAGVALKTVYVAFGTKAGVLRALWNLVLRGDEEPIPIAERAWFREMAAERDPERQVRLMARSSREIKARGAGTLMGVIRAAAPTDSDIGALWERIQREFHATQGLLVEMLDAKGALRKGLTARKATDILWALNHPDLYQLLVVEQGWSLDDYEKWLGDVLVAELVRPGG
jgi:AcrR family transcriptional regulator